MHLSNSQKSKSRIKLWDAITGHYGGLVISNGVTQQAGLSDTPIKVTGWTHEMPSSGLVTANKSTGLITIKEPRNYFISGNFSFIGQATKNYTVELYVNGSASGANMTQRAATAIDAVGAAYAGIIFIEGNSVLELRVSSDDGGTAFTPTSVQVFVEGK